MEQDAEGARGGWVDPNEWLVGFYMMQSVRQRAPFSNAFTTLVEQAVVE